MAKSLYVFGLLALMFISVTGLSGYGPEWMKIVGVANVVVILTLTMIVVVNLPTASEVRRLISVIQAAPPRVPMDHMDDDGDDRPGRRSVRN